MDGDEKQAILKDGPHVVTSLETAHVDSLEFKLCSFANHLALSRPHNFYYRFYYYHYLYNIVSTIYIIHIYITNKRTNITISSMDLPQMILLETGVPVRWLVSKSG